MLLDPTVRRCHRPVAVPLPLNQQNPQKICDAIQQPQVRRRRQVPLTALAVRVWFNCQSRRRTDQRLNAFRSRECRTAPQGRHTSFPSVPAPLPHGRGSGWGWGATLAFNHRGVCVSVFRRPPPAFHLSREATERTRS